MGDTLYSLSKHQEGYKKEFIIQCPLKFRLSQEEKKDCIQEGCAWFMPQQRACAINVSARVYGYVQAEHNR